MWARARYDFHLSSEEFWAMTPRQFTLLKERFEDARRHDELCHAWTTTAVINWSICAPKKPVSPENFMPLGIGPKRAPAQAISPAETKKLQGQHQLFLAQARTLALEIKARKGPLYERILRGGK